MFALGALLFLVSDSMAANGDITYGHVIIPANGGRPAVTISANYENWTNIYGGEPYFGWGVETSNGTKVPYKNLVSSDFTAAQADQYSDAFESVTGSPSASQRAGQASLKYNCFAYATGNTGYWVSELEPFVEEGDWSPASNPFDPSGQNRAGHTAEGAPELWDHASKVATESGCGTTFYYCKGKWGIQAVYSTSPSFVEQYFATDSYYYSG